jgi:antimicrobial peptide system SdpB family protein
LGLAKRLHHHALPGRKGTSDVLRTMTPATLRPLGRWARPYLTTPVWSSGLGLARTVLALGTAATITTTSPSILMSPLANGVRPPMCTGVTNAGLWCMTGENLALGRWLSVAILLVVASGWRPRLTAIPHWWVSWSLMVNATMVDGGDQITAVLTALLMPILITDRRHWHWQRPADSGRDPGMRHVVARASLLLIHIQVAVLYFQASVAKLGVPEWADGTAMFYWSRDPAFGSAPWIRPVMELFTYSPYGVAFLSWGTIALEFTIALAILLGPAMRRALLIVGISFHALIAIDIGLVSFFMAMTGALLLYLLPPGHHIGPVDGAATGMRRPMARRWPRTPWRSAASPTVPMPEAVTTEFRAIA